MARKDELGRHGEQLAVDYLEAHHYEILDRNWRCSHGEIDIIARRDGEISFIEVKTRAGLRFGHPFEAITVRKLARLRRLVGAWCESTDARQQRIRIDAIAVFAPPNRSPQVEHLEGIG